MRFLVALLALVALSACAGDPLKDVPRLQDVDVADPTPVVEAIAAPQETDDKLGFFERLMRKREIAPQGDQATAQAIPTEDADTAAAEVESETPKEAAEVAEAAEIATEAAPAKRGWFFGRKAKSATPSEDVAEATTKTPDAVVAPNAEVTTPETATEADPAPAVTAVEPKKRGLFGWARKTPAPETGQPETLQKAALTPDAESDAVIDDAAKAENTARSGLFSKKKAARLTGAASREAIPGEVLPFGEVARACHVKRGQLGREVAKYPEKGAKYRVYDSAPGNQGLHTFYVTGFKDGCPRQFTAALAVFGTAGMYEALRYGLPVKARSKKPTDMAYEKLKSRTCGVSKTKPCGAKLSKMEKDTVFLSLYNRFVGASGWTNLLLSDGMVLAKDS